MNPSTEPTLPVPEKNGSGFLKIMQGFVQEILSFFRYIFYGVWRGEPVPEVPPLND